MNSTTNWADVAHTAVQVGLAALIGGGFSTLASSISNNQQRNAILRKRRLELLEQAVLGVNEYFHLLVDYDCVLRREMVLMDKERAPNHAGQLKQYKDRFYKKFHGLLAVEGKLQVLREDQCVRAFLEFFNAVSAYQTIANIEHPDCTDEIVTKGFEWVVRAKRSLLEEIGKAYTRVV